MAASVASSTLINGALSYGFPRYGNPTPASTRVARSPSGSGSTPATAFRSATSADRAAQPVQRQKRMCMCSPSTHPGAFRCSLHRNSRPQTATLRPPSATTNSVVPLRAIQRYVAKRSLTSLVRSSSNRQQRRADFKPQPSRLSVMAKAEDLL